MGISRDDPEQRELENALSVAQARGLIRSFTSLETLLDAMASFNRLRLGQRSQSISCRLTVSTWWRWFPHHRACLWALGVLWKSTWATSKAWRSFWSDPEMTSTPSRRD